MCLALFLRKVHGFKRQILQGTPKANLVRLITSFFPSILVEDHRKQCAGSHMTSTSRSVRTRTSRLAVGKLVCIRISRRLHSQHSSATRPSISSTLISITRFVSMILSVRRVAAKGRLLLRITHPGPLSACFSLELMIG
jgi:hypothetical protein